MIKYSTQDPARITVLELTQLLSVYPPSMRIQFHTETKLNLDLLSAYTDEEDGKKPKYLMIDIGT